MDTGNVFSRIIGKTTSKPPNYRCQVDRTLCPKTHKESSLTVARLPFHVVVDYVFLFVRLRFSLWFQQLDCGRATDLTQNARHSAGLLGIPIRYFNESFHS